MKKREKSLTQSIETNKDLSIDFSKWKENITKKTYSYFDFDKKTIETIAKKNSQEDITNGDIRILVQALFPQYLLCNGIFDSFILFSVVGGVRVDPPKYCYHDLYAYLDNDNEAKVNKLSNEIKDLFEKNGIKYSDLWNRIFSKKAMV